MREVLSVLFRVVGALWIIPGVINLMGLSLVDPAFLVASIAFSVMLFVFPGLVLFGMGQLMAPKKEKRA